jgi:hypothetical protein
LLKCTVRTGAVQKLVALKSATTRTITRNCRNCENNPSWLGIHTMSQALAIMTTTIRTISIMSVSGWQSRHLLVARDCEGVATFFSYIICRVQVLPVAACCTGARSADRQTLFQKRSRSQLLNILFHGIRYNHVHQSSSLLEAALASEEQKTVFEGISSSNTRSERQSLP